MLLKIQMPETHNDQFVVLNRYYTHKTVLRRVSQQKVVAYKRRMVDKSDVPTILSQSPLNRGDVVRAGLRLTEALST